MSFPIHFFFYSSIALPTFSYTLFTLSAEIPLLFDHAPQDGQNSHNIFPGFPTTVHHVLDLAGLTICIVPGELSIVLVYIDSDQLVYYLFELDDVQFEIRDEGSYVSQKAVVLVVIMNGWTCYLFGAESGRNSFLLVVQTVGCANFHSNIKNLIL
jgi:hypothetical protein